MRRSGTTILYDALREDAELQCFYEPLREEDVTEGGGSGARPDDAFAETRELRSQFRDQRYPEIELEEFNWGGPRAPELELEPQLPEHCRELLRHLIAQGPGVAIKETRLHHKIGALAELDPQLVLVHLVRDPRAVAASTLLGRRRRLDLYPDADAFFGRRTERKLWSSRAISERLANHDRPAIADAAPDVLRPLAVWAAAFETTHDDGRRLLGDRYLLVRLENLRADPASALASIYGRLGRQASPEAVAWARETVRAETEVHLAGDRRWADAIRAAGAEPALEAAGYADLVAR